MRYFERKKLLSMIVPTYIDIHSKNYTINTSHNNILLGGVEYSRSRLSDLIVTSGVGEFGTRSPRSCLSAIARWNARVIRFANLLQGSLKRRKLGSIQLELIIIYIHIWMLNCSYYVMRLIIPSKDICNERPSTVVHYSSFVWIIPQDRHICAYTREIVRCRLEPRRKKDMGNVPCEKTRCRDSYCMCPRPRETVGTVIPATYNRVVFLFSPPFRIWRKRQVHVLYIFVILAFFFPPLVPCQGRKTNSSLN